MIRSKHIVAVLLCLLCFPLLAGCSQQVQYIETQKPDTAFSLYPFPQDPVVYYESDPRLAHDPISCIVLLPVSVPSAPEEASPFTDAFTALLSSALIQWRLDQKLGRYAEIGRENVDFRLSRKFRKISRQRLEISYILQQRRGLSWVDLYRTRPQQHEIATLPAASLDSVLRDLSEFIVKKPADKIIAVPGLYWDGEKYNLRKPGFIRRLEKRIIVALQRPSHSSAKEEELKLNGGVELLDNDTVLLTLALQYAGDGKPITRMYKVDRSDIFQISIETPIGSSENKPFENLNILATTIADDVDYILGENDTLKLQMAEVIPDDIRHTLLANLFHRIRKAGKKVLNIQWEPRIDLRWEIGVIRVSLGHWHASYYVKSSLGSKVPSGEFYFLGRQENNCKKGEAIASAKMEAMNGFLTHYCGGKFKDDRFSTSGFIPKSTVKNKTFDSISPCLAVVEIKITQEALDTTLVCEPRY